MKSAPRLAWAFFRFPRSAACTALLVAATFLISPYTLNCDLLLLAPAALLFLRPPVDGYRPGERLIYLAVWLIPYLTSNSTPLVFR